MPPPHLPPPERGEGESAPTPGFRRHVGKLFWVGVAIAPIAALLLVLGSGVGPLRAAAVLAVFSVVIIGLSVVLRDDAAMVKDDVEEQLRTEVDRLRNDIDSLRRGVEVSVHRELERVHRELEATRREGVIRAESTRLNRLTGALPAGEDDYPVDSRGRGDRPMRAIAARNEMPEPAPGYDWFGGGADGEPGAEQRQEPIRYGAGTYGSARPAPDPADSGEWPRQPAAAHSAAAQPAAAKPAGTEYGRRRPEGDQNAEAAGRFQPGTYGSGAAAGYDPEDTSGGRRGGRRRAPDDEAPAYELIDYDDAPPVYTPQRIDAGVYGSRAAGADDRAINDPSGESGTIDYGEFWSRSGAAPHPDARREAPRREADARGDDPRANDPRQADSRPNDPHDGDRSSADEWSSWRRGEDTGGWDTGKNWDTGSNWDSGSNWDTGSQRYNRDDPQVITGAITGDVLDIPYTVGGQALSEPGFGAGNGFAAGGGFGAGNGFGAQRWDELPDVTPAPGWPPASDTARSDRPTVAEPSAEFELPSLEHLPQVGGSAPADEPNNAGGRHARHASADDDAGRYRSW